LTGATLARRGAAEEHEGEGRQEQESAAAAGVAIGGPWRGRRGAK